MKARLLTVAAVLAAAGCVAIDTAPGGVQSIRLDPLPRAVVAGDTLRDTLGRPARLRAVAFDDKGAEVSGTTFTYGYVPITPDTGAGARAALVVDPATGIVRATTPRRVAQARVAATLGTRLQILDTLQVVPRPTALTYVDTTLRTLRFQYPCDDTSRVVTPADSVVLILSRWGTASPALAVALSADSAGRALPVPRYYVRYEIVRSSRPIPRGPSPFGDVRPAVYLFGGRDAPLGYDTTNTSGQTGTRLRVLPSLLTRAAVPDSVLEVVVRATAIAGRDSVVATPREFTVRLVRRTTSITRENRPLACP